MNKSTKISLIIIFVLLSIIVLHKNYNKFSSNIPDLSSWDLSADEMSIEQATGEIRLYKKNNKWVINDIAYYADQAKVDGLENKLKNIKLVDLVSKRKHYNRFELNKEKALQVIVKLKGEIVRKILIGKTSSTNKQVYVKLANHDEVFLASGDLRSDFNVKVEDLRDKEMLRVNESEIVSLAVKSRKGTYALEKKVVKSSSKDKKSEKKDLDKQEWMVKNKKNLKLDQEKVNSLLRAFSNVIAESFSDKMIKLKSTLYSAEIKTAEKTFTFDILFKDKDGKYLCKSSESDYLFYLAKQQVDSFLKSLNELK